MPKSTAIAFQDKSPISGSGVFACVNIPKGHPILQIDDSRLVTDESPLRESEGEYHCDYLPLLENWFIEEHKAKIAQLVNSARVNSACELSPLTFPPFFAKLYEKTTRCLR